MHFLSITWSTYKVSPALQSPLRPSASQFLPSSTKVTMMLTFNTSDYLIYVWTSHEQKPTECMLYVWLLLPEVTFMRSNLTAYSTVVYFHCHIVFPYMNSVLYLFILIYYFILMLMKVWVCSSFLLLYIILWRYFVRIFWCIFCWVYTCKWNCWVTGCAYVQH